MSNEVFELGLEIERIQAEIERTIQVAGLKNDPTLPLIQVHAASFNIQWRLHDQAIHYQRDAGKQLDRQLIDTVKQGETALEVRRLSIIDQLAPLIAVEVAKAAKARIWVLKLKTGLAGSAILLAIVVVGGCLTYGTGYRAGQMQGEMAGKTISAAMAAGPGAATAWAGLMALNDPVSALAECKKAISSDSEGRRSCSMPIWLDPFPREYGG